MFSIDQFEISKISVIGAGHIGPDILLHLARIFYSEGVTLLLEDVSPSALDKAKVRIQENIYQVQVKDRLDNETCKQILNSITFSTNLRDIHDSNIVIESATENPKIKNSIFKQIETLCSSDCLFLSNSSHIIPEIIFDKLQFPARCLVTHYFYPADKNSMIELIPMEQTAPITLHLVNLFYRYLGKKTMTVKSSYGFAVVPIFEGICQIALDFLKDRAGSVKEIDQAAKEALGLRLGPFALLNLSGGNPLLDHGLEGMNQHLMSWFTSPKNLGEAVMEQQTWATASDDEIVEVPSKTKEKLITRFRGAYFALASFIADLMICDLNELDHACKAALSIRPPFTFMNELGTLEAYQLTERFCAEELGFRIPKSLLKAAQKGRWNLN